MLNVGELSVTGKVRIEATSEIFHAVSHIKGNGGYPLFSSIDSNNNPIVGYGITSKSDVDALLFEFYKCEDFRVRGKPLGDVDFRCKLSDSILLDSYYKNFNYILILKFCIIK